MLTRAVVLAAALVAAGCVTGGGARGVSPEHPFAATSPPAEEEVPTFFQKAPWSMAVEPGGHRLVFIHEQAGLRFSPQSGDLERANFHVYDQDGRDVSFYYEGVFANSTSKCRTGLSVYVYPATEPLGRHLQAVRAEIVRVHPDARVTERILNLDLEHKGTGVHAAYVNPGNGVDSFEGVSLFERAGWFIKYRMTIEPAGRALCELRVRAGVADLQVRTR